jgi:hypothetical protein
MNKSLSECLLGRVKNKVKNVGLNVRSKKKIVQVLSGLYICLEPKNLAASRNFRLQKY